MLQACQFSTNSELDREQQYLASKYNIQLGLAYLKQNDVVRAKKKLLTALELSPQAAEAYTAMAYYFEKTGDQQIAIKYYQTALRLMPHSGEQLNIYGSFLCRMGKYAEAEKYFLLATQDQRYLYTAGAYENAGICAAAAADYTKARHYFEEALLRDPGRKQSISALINNITLRQNGL